MEIIPGRVISIAHACSYDDHKPAFRIPQ